MKYIKGEQQAKHWRVPNRSRRAIDQSRRSIMALLRLSLLLWAAPLFFFFFFDPAKASNTTSAYSLDSVRDALTRMEDSIIFALIERARLPINAAAYLPRDHLHLPAAQSLSIAEIYVRCNEALEAKLGRYQNPEEIPFFPHNLPPVEVPPYDYSPFLYEAAASVNVSETIWSIYFDELLPMFSAHGDDGSYDAAVASDLLVLQALSKRIHYGRFVAEVKFRDSPRDYVQAIQNKDRGALMELVTAKSVEEMVEARVEKKAKVYGQDVTIGPTPDDDNKNTYAVAVNGGNGNGNGKAEYKVDPLVVRGLYTRWVIPLTKLIEVDYLLRRLDPLI